MTMLTFKNKSFGMLSPVVLDLDGNGIDLKSIKKAKSGFDMNGDGIADDTGWTSKNDAFLVIDRNKDGKITDAAELSLAAEDKDAMSGLSGLAGLDSNSDGVIDAKDARFGELRLWGDANGNGVTDDGELKSLSEAGTKLIGLTTHNLDGSVKVGENALISTAILERADGTTGTVGNTMLSCRPGREWQNPWSRSAARGGVDLTEALTALRARKEPDLGADGFNFRVPDATPKMPTALVEAGAAETGTARLLELIRQDMASFGNRDGEAEVSWRRGDMSQPMDFFA